MPTELLNLSSDLLKSEELDVEGHVKNEGGEEAPEVTGDDEVEAHLLNENLLDSNLLDNQLDLCGICGANRARSEPRASFVAPTRMTGAMTADENQIPLDEELAQIGAQLDWVRGYL